MIDVLCAAKNSIYKSLPGFDVWDKERNAWNYNGSNMIIAHPPCAQWSKLRALATEDLSEKLLAWICLDFVNKNGGILEHPVGSLFLKEAGIEKQCYKVDQFWFGFPTKKPTMLYFKNCHPVALPLNFNAYEKRVEDLHSSMRSRTTVKLALWLQECITTKQQKNETQEFTQKK